jgi:hypothetical protein
MRILICGEHDWRCSDLAERVIRRLIARYGTQLVIVHGFNSGADTAFEVAAQAARLTTELHAITGVDRNYFKERAGPLRDARMVKLGADLCIVVHRNLAASSDTKNCAAQSIVAGIPTYLIDADEGVPIKLEADDPRLGRRKRCL